MGSRQQLSHFQFAAILFWSVMGTGILTLPWATGQFVIRDSWMSALLLFVVSAFAAGIAVLFVRTFPGQSLVEGLLRAFGPWFGRLWSGWFLLWLLIFTPLVIRELTVFLEVTVLPETPLYVLSGLAVVATAFLASSGVEVIGRIAVLITPVALLGTFLLALLAMPHMDMSRLTPILADGWRPVWRGALVPWAWAAETLTGLQFISALTGNRTRVGRVYILAGLMMAVLGAVAEVVITSVLGYQRSYSLFPILEVVRVIQYGEFFERFDPLYVMGATILIIVKGSIFLYSFCSALEQTTRLKSYRSIVWGSAFPVWAASIFLWNDSATLAEYMLFTIPVYYLVTFFGLPVLAILTERLRQLFVRSTGGEASGQ